ncbi:hypothetical protein NVS47_09320 [Dehalobacterium formicoaceticum]|uniref:DUF1440 domain-containing protein n=1 Tax=Dehalobacterium formicoaceticum TaxID=51515 RepID=A0ABT1Y492_9FIRM|nr:hypothetical protein [Dehalobacterium formicoaceticum]MCR6545705.1 hypothetical protein [Dehalobacterium formicoaceticum]
MDRFFRGFAAGVLAGIPMNIWDLFSYYYLHFSDLRYLDWSAVTIFGHLPHSMGELVFALFSHFLWVGFMGTIFAYLIELKITSRLYWLKGIIFGYVAGFLIYAAGIALKMPHIMTRSLDSVITQFIGASIWGFTMAYLLHRMDNTSLAKKV